MPAGGILSMRAQYGIAMTGTIPMPSETTHTSVNARAFASDRPAWRRSRQIPLNIPLFNHENFVLQSNVSLRALPDIAKL
jgi:hypothetical protein